MAQRVKNPPANAGDTGDTGSIPGSGRFPGGGNGNPLQYSSLKNLTDRGAWRTTAQRVTKSHMQLSTHTHTHTHTHTQHTHTHTQLCEAGATDTSVRTQESDLRHHTSVPGHSSTLVRSARAPQGLLQPKAGFPFSHCTQRGFLTEDEAFSSHFQFLLVSEGPRSSKNDIRRQGYRLNPMSFLPPSSCVETYPAVRWCFEMQPLGSI